VSTLAALPSPATPATQSNPGTRSEAAKAQLILVFGTKDYAMTWAQRTERFGITPKTFQATLATGVPAIRLVPGAQTVVEEAKEKA